MEGGLSMRRSDGWLRACGGKAQGFHHRKPVRSGGNSLDCHNTVPTSLRSPGTYHPTHQTSSILDRACHPIFDSVQSKRITCTVVQWFVLHCVALHPLTHPSMHPHIYKR